MPPKKAPGSPSSEHTDAGASALITLTNEQFQTLLKEVRESVIKSDDSSTPGSNSFCASNETTPGSFANCTVRFNGSRESDVDAFIDHIQTYKDCMNISDVNALRGLSILLEGLAATWWQGIKSTVLEWKHAIELLKEVYSKKLPAHLIYREIFKLEQESDESTELFVCRIRALFAQLEYTLPETAQLDMVYGLLLRRVRKRLPRSDITTFSELLRRSREIEHSTRETNTEPTEKIPSDKYCSVSSNIDKKVRSKCVYCKNFGHSKDSCSKLKKKEVVKDSQPSTTTKSGSISCYGCGNPGFIRSNCPKCKVTSGEAGSAEFYTAKVAQQKPTRPLIAFEIREAQGVAYLDTGASQSIAGYTLYQYLRSNGYKFTSEKKTITYADGNPVLEDILLVDVVIDLKERSIPITFIVLPTKTGNRTLLDADFIHRANVVINISAKKWCFADKPRIKFKFADEPILRNTESKYFAETISTLRSDEGIKLNDQDQQDAHDELKKQLTSAPILRQADCSLPYVLKIDASGYAIGACLLQGEGPEERPVEYGNRLLTGPERSYTTTERVGSFRGYLEECKVTALRSVRERHEAEQDRRKGYADRRRKKAPIYQVGDKVLVAVHVLSNKRKGITSKLMPKRDVPYIILSRRSPTTYAVGDINQPGVVLGVYHTSHLTPYFDSATDVSKPLVPIRKRGRPRKVIKDTDGKP